MHNALCTWTDFREGAPNITTVNTGNVDVNINLKCYTHRMFDCSIREYQSI